MMSQEQEKELCILSKQIQIQTLRSIASIGRGHVGGCLSICDLLAVLYGKHLRFRPDQPGWDGRDRLVVSKGHSGPAVYSALALESFFPTEELLTLNRPHTRLPSHCNRILTPGIDMSTGSLGQGSSAAAGMALGLQMDGKENDVYLILGDGEIQEGQVWEMALFAAHHKLGHLIAFVDDNGLQIDGPTDRVCSLGDIAEKFRAFGWDAVTVDGHDLTAIDEAIENAKKMTGRPSAIIIQTVKGHGWSRIENQVSCHHMAVSPADLEEAVAEMEDELRALSGGVK